MTKRAVPTPKQLCELLRYELETGKLFWRARPVDMFATERRCNAWNIKYAGKEAFTCSVRHGYLIGKLYGCNYFAHRVIWAIVTGGWPLNGLDHIDHDTANNRMSNLRVASPKENARNRLLSRNNITGVNGVSWSKSSKKWMASVKVEGRKIHLGYFNDVSDAIVARSAADKKYGFHRNHGMIL